MPEKKQSGFVFNISDRRDLDPCYGYLYYGPRKKYEKLLVVQALGHSEARGAASTVKKEKKKKKRREIV